jgi:hypothetical protein
VECGGGGGGGGGATSGFGSFVSVDASTATSTVIRFVLPTHRSTATCFLVSFVLSSDHNSSAPTVRSCCVVVSPAYTLSCRDSVQHHSLLDSEHVARHAAAAAAGAVVAFAE